MLVARTSSLRRVREQDVADIGDGAERHGKSSDHKFEERSGSNRLVSDPTEQQYGKHRVRD
jgi:hypothetical protein